MVPVDFPRVLYLDLYRGGTAVFHPPNVHEGGLTAQELGLSTPAGCFPSNTGVANEGSPHQDRQRDLPWHTRYLAHSGPLVYCCASQPTLCI